jgi:hypothetical protein
MSELDQFFSYQELLAHHPSSNAWNNVRLQLGLLFQANAKGTGFFCEEKCYLLHTYIHTYMLPFGNSAACAKVFPGMACSNAFGDPI